MKTDVTIIGAGMLGVSCAYHLAERGVAAVVVEREPVPAAHASGKNAGMFRQLYRHPQLTDWAVRSRSSWPKDVASEVFQQTGSLIVGRDVPKHHDELFSESPITDETGSVPAVFTLTDGLVDSCGLIQGIISEIKKTKVSFRYRTALEHADYDGSFWRLTLSSGEKIESQYLVNAAGAWAQTLFPAPLQPYARHLFVIKGWKELPEQLQNHGFYWNEQDGWYMRRWGKNEVLFSICDKAPATPETFTPNPEIQFSVAEKLTALFPKLFSNLSIARHWHCFRTYTEDQLPYFGFDKHLPTLFWLSAFGGFGISTGFSAGEDAARIIAGEPLKLVEIEPRAKFRKIVQRAVG